MRKLTVSLFLVLLISTQLKAEMNCIKMDDNALVFCRDNTYVELWHVTADGARLVKHYVTRKDGVQKCQGGGCVTEHRVQVTDASGEINVNQQ